MPPVRRSTLADANKARDWRIYAELAQRLIAQARRLYANEDLGFDLANTVYALDSTTIDLCLAVFTRHKRPILCRSCPFLVPPLNPNPRPLPGRSTKPWPRAPVADPTPFDDAPQRHDDLPPGRSGPGYVISGRACCASVSFGLRPMRCPLR
jgi:hypothetical protein